MTASIGSAPEDVLRLLAADVDLLVLDVLRLVRERAPIDADHAALAMQDAHHALAEPAARARHEDRALATRQRRRAAWSGGWPGGRCDGARSLRARGVGHQKKTLFLALRPRLIIDWIVAFTTKTFSSMTASSSSGSPSKRIGSPK